MHKNSISAAIHGWNLVEKRLNNEVLWLRSAVPLFSHKRSLPHCNNCALRKLASLIVFGGVTAKEINRHEKLKSFWKTGGSSMPNREEIFHGREWHRATMAAIEKHFLARRFRVVREPVTQAGRADLGVYKKGFPNLILEVGTITSYSKLFIDLMHLPVGAKLLIVPNDDLLIEFTNIKAREIFPSY